jgi:acetylornithine deacetylase/succinyl-diaminopimelate desuccinylase-like protein
MGFADIRYDAMGNLIATYGAGTSNKSLMLIGNAMNQPAATMPNPYAGDVVDGAAYGLPGECVMGKGASEQKANLAAMLHAMEVVIPRSTASSSSLAASRARPASTMRCEAWSRARVCAPTWRCWAGRD